MVNNCVAAPKIGFNIAFAVLRLKDAGGIVTLEVAFMFSRVTLLAITFAVASCVPSVLLPASGTGELDPMTFFTGRTHGDGRLDKLFSAPINVTVESVGRTEGDTFILDQTIRDGVKPPHVRRWTMRPISRDQYSGTLTEAIGPVQVTIRGRRAYIRYTMKGGLRVDQQLALQGDGRTILNRLDVQKLGVRVATLNETIRKVH